MSAFDEAWSVLKALPFKKPGGGLPFKQSGGGLPFKKPGDLRPAQQGTGKWLPGTVPAQQGTGKWLPNQPTPVQPTPVQTPVQPTQAGTIAVTQSHPADGELQNWYEGTPTGETTKVNNNPPFGPEGGQ